MSTQSVGVVPKWVFGDKLWKARRHAGLEQSDMARALGVSTPTISAWERGTKLPRNQLEVVRRWAEITGVDPSWLAGMDTPPSPEANSGIRAVGSPTGKSVAHVTSRALRRRFDTSTGQKGLSAA